MQFTQRGLLILMAAGAIALGPSAPKTSDSSSVPDDGTTAQASYQVNQKEFYLDPATAWGLQPGLKATILDWSNVAGGKKPSVHYTLTDDLGRPLDRLGLATPGAISVRFTVATWDGHYYKNLIVSGGNPSRDNAGTIVTNAMGDYTYTFATALPAFDDTKAVTLFMGASRATSAILGKNYYVNLTKDFIPSTGAATTNWNVTTTAKCNACHDPLALHGGNYFEVKVCALCHNVNNFPTPLADGDWFNGQAWFHQIHSSNSSIGSITYPQLIQRCETCHDSSLSGGTVWYTYPSRAACGACHANVNFATGENHSAQNIPQADDTACASCHPAQGTAEWDASIKGSHTLESDSTQLKGLTAAIVSVTNAGPGLKPVIKFKMTNKDGSKIAPNAPDFTTLRGSLNVLFGGDTADYYYLPGSVRQSATGAAYDATTGIATYTFTKALPADAKGTWTFAIEARRDVALLAADGTTKSMYEEGAPNPTLDVSVDGSPVKARRATVLLSKCNACHYKLGNTFSHGGQRLTIQECVMCHNPAADDSGRRTEAQMPAEGIEFAHMIHRIHTGEELQNDFTVYGFGGNPTNFNEVTYPGDRRDCLVCHISFTPSTSATNPTTGINPPLGPGLLNVITPRDTFSPQGPATAACLGCHDSEDFQAHAYINTATFPSGKVAEACGACHGGNSDLSPAKVHAQ